MFKRITFGLLICMSSAVQAAVITDLSQKDWVTSGDGAITIDSSTGLEWLDLTVTQGNSLIETEADTAIFGDFRWATMDEVDDLFDAVIMGSGNRMKPGESYYAFADLLGQTITGGTEYVAGSLRTSGLKPAALAHASYTPTKDITEIFEIYNWNYADAPHTAVGHWLVRSTDVPEPATLALFAAGLIGVGAARRKRSIQ